MNKKYTYKVWQMNQDEKTILQIVNTHLILWDKGCCFIGYTNEKTVVMAKYFVFEHDIQVTDLEGIFMDEPIFGGEEPVTNIWLCTTRQSIIPKQLYKESLSKDWIRKVYYIGPDEIIIAIPLLKPAGYITFPIENSLHSFVADWFPNAIIDNIVNASFSDNQSQNMTLCIMPNIATLATFDTKQLLQYVVFEYTNADEILYKIGSTLGN